MKLYLVNKEHYIVCDDYCDAERIYRERFTNYDDNAIKSIELISTIKTGDYVNGRKVYQVGYNFQDNLVLKMSINKDGKINNYEDFIYEKDIKSIVTKEQFESMEYKVGE